MSYDVYVLSQREPTKEQVRRLLSPYPAASVTGSLSEPANLLVDAEATEGWAFIIDPPSPFEPEDPPFDPEDERIQDRLNPSPVWDSPLPT